MRRNLIVTEKYLTLLGMVAIPAITLQSQSHHPNVLFISVDDLKPLMSAYGDSVAITPGLDKLAREGSTFQNCYVQQAISGPSRASVLTGMRPDKTKVWDLNTNFRQVNPNAVSIMEYFLKNGYETAGTGKIFHEGSTGPGHDAPSWSIPWVYDNAPTYVKFKTENGKKGPATECVDVPDNSYRDGVCAEVAIKLMHKLKAGQKPFFLAVGFHKPHLPFVAPKKYWDLYKRDQFHIASYQQKAENSPDIAYHQSTELKQYTDIPEFDSYSDDVLKHLPVDKQKELIHGYYASVSYMDAQLMKVLNELDTLKLTDNTIVVLWSDHGWHLGDHGLWNKHTNFEQATHTCLIIRGIKGALQDSKPTTLCELVDVFPTLCELTGIPVPDYLDGVSLVPAMINPQKELRQFAFSQYPQKALGYTVRNKQFRYTEWVEYPYTTALPYRKAHVIATEMYNYFTDPLETKSIVNEKSYSKEKRKMKNLFLKAMKREHRQFKKYSKLANWQTPVKTE